MDFRAILFFASALLVQSISGQNCRRISVPSRGAGSSIISGSSAVSNNGGSLIITSLSPISPSGISVLSNLDLNGDLLVSGTLPYLSAVGFSGNVPTGGSGSVDYSCGSTAQVGITSVNGGGSLSGCGCGI